MNRAIKIIFNLENPFVFNNIDIVSVRYQTPAIEERDMDDRFSQGEASHLNGWDNSILANFSKFLAFSIEGFEGEILSMLKRMQKRIE